MSHYNRMKGFALIEVVVALFILSLGLFSIATLQLSVLQRAQESYWQNLATTQLSSLFERFRANQSNSARDHELMFWNVINSRLLPQGKGDYSCIENFCTVNLYWVGKNKHTLSLSSYL